MAAHQAGLSFQPPALETESSPGVWHVVIPEIGLPVGRPQTIVVDVTPHTRLGARKFRIKTTLRVYWDQVLVDKSTPVPTIVAAGSMLTTRTCDGAVSRPRSPLAATAR